MQIYKQSNIVDEFEGWDGDTVYELDDGSQWQMSSYQHSYRYSYRPIATVWRDGGRYYLQVEGMNDMQQVMPV